MSGADVRSVPVVIVAGFLGSGKTTLLNHLLRNAVGARIGVLVNDFGAVNIDALLVAGSAEDAISLPNGCMCCEVDADGLDATLGELAAPSAGLDAIVIEASGIAEPRALIRMITAVADPAVRYGGLVYVLDAAMIEATRTEHPEIDRHVEIADLVVVNKADLVDETQLEDIVASVSELNPTAPQLITTDAQVDPEVLFEVEHRDRTTQAQVAMSAGGNTEQLGLDALLLGDDPTSGSLADRDGPAGHLHDRFASVSVQFDAPLDPRRLAGFLERPPVGVYRIKGVVELSASESVAGFSARERFEVHAVGGFVRADRAQGPTARSSLVAIGAGIDEQAVERAMRELVAEKGLADEFGILSIARYLPDAATPVDESDLLDEAAFGDAGFDDGGFEDGELGGEPLGGPLTGEEYLADPEIACDP